MSYANGRLPASALSPIPGGRLEHEAAAAWNAMYEDAKRDGVILRPTGSQSSYRDYAAQVYFWGLYQRGGNLAARPGFSNHGNGTAIDTPSAAGQAWIRTHGAKYGWEKIEAFGEPWHFNYVGGFKGGDPHKGPPEVWKRGQAGGWVRSLQEDLKHWLPGAGLDADGAFGGATEQAVKDFQFVHGLETDGKVGDATRRALHRKNVLTRRELVEVNRYWLHRRANALSGVDEKRWIAARARAIEARAKRDGPKGWRTARRRDRHTILRRTVRGIKL